MTKKKGTKLGSSSQHLQSDESRIPEYERLRILRIKENNSRMKALGLVEKSRLLMDRDQTKKGNCGKANKKRAIGEDDIYRPDQDFDIEHQLDSSEHTESNQSSMYAAGKRKKEIPKAMAIAVAFRKSQQKVQLNSSLRRVTASASQLQQSTDFESAVVQLSTNNTSDIDGFTKSTRGPTMCNKVHGRTEEERKEITLNEFGQPVGPDDETCNEFISFLGTVARKANILPLTVPRWPKLRKEKENELWEYVRKHYIIAVEGKKWVLQTIGSSWRTYKCSLKQKHFQPYENDKMRMVNRPGRVPKSMFKNLLKIWNDPDYQKRCEKNKANRLVGRENNIMHTSGPRSFARVQHKWKKDRKTTRNPTLAEMFIETRKQKITKRKPGDMRDKLIGELKEAKSQNDAESVISTIVCSDSNKKCLNLHGRGVSSTQLKQKAMISEMEKKHAEQMEAMQKDYEDKRQQDIREVANGIKSLFSQLQQQSPHMFFDLSMFGSFFHDGQSKMDANSKGILQLNSSASTSKAVNDIEEEEYDDEDDDD